MGNRLRIEMVTRRMVGMSPSYLMMPQKYLSKGNMKEPITFLMMNYMDTSNAFVKQ